MLQDVLTKWDSMLMMPEQVIKQKKVGYRYRPDFCKAIKYI